MYRVLFGGTSRPIDFNQKEKFAAQCARIIVEQPGIELVGIVSDYKFSCIPEEAVWMRVKRRMSSTLIDFIKTHQIDVLLTAQYPWILEECVLNQVPYAFNVHSAKIPDYRGWNRVTHMILNGEKTATTTVHWVAPKVDMGDIAYEEQINIAPDITAEQLLRDLQKATLVNLRKLVIDLAANKEIPRTPIQGEGHFYSKHSLDGLKLIKNPLDPVEVDKKSRAFYCPPYPPAYIELDGVKYSVTPHLKD